MEISADSNGHKTFQNVMLYAHGMYLETSDRGGYAAVLHYDDGVKKHEKELADGYNFTTQHRIEMKSVIEPLRALRQPCRVKIFTISTYIVNGFELEWPKLSRENSLADCNEDLWRELFSLCGAHEVTFELVGDDDRAQESRYCKNRACFEASNPPPTEDECEGNIPFNPDYLPDPSEFVEDWSSLSDPSPSLPLLKSGNNQRRVSQVNKGITTQVMRNVKIRALKRMDVTNWSVNLIGAAKYGWEPKSRPNIGSTERRSTEIPTYATSAIL